MALPPCDMKELHKGQWCEQKDTRANLLTMAEHRGKAMPPVETGTCKVEGCSSTDLDHRP